MVQPVRGARDGKADRSVRADYNQELGDTGERRGERGDLCDVANEDTLGRVAPRAAEHRLGGSPISDQGIHRAPPPCRHERLVDQRSGPASRSSHKYLAAPAHRRGGCGGLLGGPFGQRSLHKLGEVLESSSVCGRRPKPI